jgi:hypothetical protein
MRCLLSHAADKAEVNVSAVWYIRNAMTSWSV